MGGRGEGLEPPPRVRWRGYKGYGAHTRLARGPKVRAVPIEAVRHQILERQHTGAVEVLHHGSGQLGLRLPRDLLRHLTFGPPCCVGVGEPRLRDEQPFIDQCIALPRGIRRKYPHLTILDLP
jgi:hypothetical protein